MNCVVTAGPTYEPLDEVRRITSFSTGKLGSELADYLTEQGHRVLLFRSLSAVFHVNSRASQVVEFTTGADLENRLQALTQQSVDAVFHAAAVSDFRFGRVWSRSPKGELTELNARKISTRRENLLAELIPTPKIIRRLRGWFPRAWLVGWKYEIEGDRAGAALKARHQLEESHTDACVVNGPAYGNGFGLVTRDENCIHLPDRAGLFSVLAGSLQNHFASGTEPLGPTRGNMGPSRL